MEKRVLLAIVLTLMVMICYSFYLSRTMPPPPPMPFVAPSPVSGENPAAPVPAITPALVSAGSPVPETTEASETIETEKLSVEFLSRGAGASEITLRDYYADQHTKTPLPIVKTAEPATQALALQCLDPRFDTTDSVYETRKEDGRLIFTRRLSPTLSISKIYGLLKGGYGVTLSVVFDNEGPEAEKMSYRLLVGNLLTDSSSLNQRFKERAALEEGDLLLRGEKMRGARRPTWVSVRDRHFCLVLAPVPPLAGMSAYLSPKGKRGSLTEEQQVGLETGEFVVLPGKNIEHNFLLYTGPNDERALAAVGPDLEKALNYGKLDKLCRLMLNLLRWIGGITHNYGLGIILLTVLVNLVLFPLSRYNLVTTQQMQTKTLPMQPEIAKLKERYKENPQKLNEETMKLYKKHGVSPLAMGCGTGCLTLILQMPFFIALYVILIRSVELRGAGFLWIRDLSQPDAAFEIPFTIPFFKTNYINVLPILTTAAMLLQQKAMLARQKQSLPGGTELDPQQRQQQQLMAVMMALMFGLLFYNFPAGFNLYLLTNLVCMWLVQLSVRKPLPPAEPAVK